MNPEQEKKNLKRVLKQTIKMQFPVSMHWLMVRLAPIFAISAILKRMANR